MANGTNLNLKKSLDVLSRGFRPVFRRLDGIPIGRNEPAKYCCKRDLGHVPSLEARCRMPAPRTNPPTTKRGLYEEVACVCAGDWMRVGIWCSSSVDRAFHWPWHGPAERNRCERKSELPRLYVHPGWGALHPGKRRQWHRHGCCRYRLRAVHHASCRCIRTAGGHATASSGGTLDCFAGRRTHHGLQRRIGPGYGYALERWNDRANRRCLGSGV